MSMWKSSVPSNASTPERGATPTSTSQPRLRAATIDCTKSASVISPLTLKQSERPATPQQRIVSPSTPPPVPASGTLKSFLNHKLRRGSTASEEITPMPKETKETKAPITPQKLVEQIRAQSPRSPPSRPGSQSAPRLQGSERFTSADSLLNSDDFKNRLRFGNRWTNLAAVNDSSVHLDTGSTSPRSLFGSDSPTLSMAPGAGSSARPSQSRAGAGVDNPSVKMKEMLGLSASLPTPVLLFQSTSMGSPTSSRSGSGNSIGSAASMSPRPTPLSSTSLSMSPRQVPLSSASLSMSMSPRDHRPHPHPHPQSQSTASNPNRSRALSSSSPPTKGMLASHASSMSSSPSLSTTTWKTATKGASAPLDPQLASHAVSTPVASNPADKVAGTDLGPAISLFFVVGAIQTPAFPMDTPCHCDTKTTPMMLARLPNYPEYAGVEHRKLPPKVAELEELCAVLPRYVFPEDVPVEGIGITETNTAFIRSTFNSANELRRSYEHTYFFTICAADTRWYVYCARMNHWQDSWSATETAINTVIEANQPGYSVFEGDPRQRAADIECARKDKPKGTSFAKKNSDGNIDDTGDNPDKGVAPGSSVSPVRCVKVKTRFLSSRVFGVVSRYPIFGPLIQFVVEIASAEYRNQVAREQGTTDMTVVRGCRFFEAIPNTRVGGSTRDAQGQLVRVMGTIDPSVMYYPPVQGDVVAGNRLITIIASCMAIRVNSVQPRFIDQVTDLDLDLIFPAIQLPPIVEEFEWWQCSLSCVPVLLQRIQLDYIVRIFAHVLAGHSIIFVSAEAGVVSAVVMAFMTLVRPLAWEGLAMPIVPLSKDTYLTSPVPGLFGVVHHIGSARQASSGLAIGEVVSYAKALYDAAEANGLPRPAPGSLSDRHKLQKMLRLGKDQQRGRAGLRSMLLADVRRPDMAHFLAENTGRIVVNIDYLTPSAAAPSLSSSSSSSSTQSKESRSPIYYPSLEACTEKYQPFPEPMKLPFGDALIRDKLSASASLFVRKYELALSKQSTQRQDPIYACNRTEYNHVQQIVLTFYDYVVWLIHECNRITLASQVGKGLVAASPAELRTDSFASFVQSHTGEYGDFFYEFIRSQQLDSYLQELARLGKNIHPQREENNLHVFVNQ